MKKKTGSHAPFFHFYDVVVLVFNLEDVVVMEFHYCHIHTAHTDNENYLSRALERLGTTALSKDQEAEIGAAFIKFAVVTKELSALLRTLVIFLNILLFNKNLNRFNVI